MSALRTPTSMFGWRNTDLLSAAWSGDEEAVRSLLEQRTPDQRYEELKVQNFWGNTALHSAALEGDTDTVRFLLSSLTPQDQLTLLKVQENRGRTALHWAAYRGDTDTARFLLSSLTPQDQLTLLKVQTSVGNTALHSAAHRGDTDTARFLLSSLTPQDQLSLLDMQNKAGRTARDVAIERDHPVTAACLQQIRDAAEEAISARDEVEQRRGIKEDQIVEQDKTIRHLSGQIGNQENTIREGDAKVQQLEAALDEVEQRLGIEVDQIDEQENTIGERDGKVQQLEAALDEVEQRRGIKVDQIDEQENTIGERDGKVQQLEAADEVRSVRERIVKLTERRLQLDAELQQLKAVEQSMGTKAEELDVPLREKSVQPGERVAEVQQLEDDTRSTLPVENIVNEPKSPIKLAGNYALVDVIGDLQAAPSNQSNKESEGFDALVKRIYSICNSYEDMKRPSIFASTINPYKILVQGVGITPAKKEIIKLALEPGVRKYYNYLITVEEVAKGANGKPDYTTAFGLPWHLYQCTRPIVTEEFSAPEYLGTIGTLIMCGDGGDRRLYGVTSGHLWSKDELEELEGSDEGLRQISTELSGTLEVNIALDAKSQNQLPTSFSSVYISYKKNTEQGMMTDIALVGMDRQVFTSKAFRQSERVHLVQVDPVVQVPPVDLPVDSSLVFKQKRISFILPISSQSEINMLVDDGICLLIGGREDLICYVYPYYVVERFPGQILFTANKPLVPGNSGSSVMVYDKKQGECYIIGIFHGMVKIPRKWEEEVYVAVSLSSSLESINNIYRGTLLGEIEIPQGRVPICDLLRKSACLLSSTYPSAMET